MSISTNCNITLNWCFQNCVWGQENEGKIKEIQEESGRWPQGTPTLNTTCYLCFISFVCPINWMTEMINYSNVGYHGDYIKTVPLSNPAQTEGISVWSWCVLPVSVWVFPWCSAFLPQAKTCMFKSIWNSAVAPRCEWASERNRRPVQWGLLILGLAKDRNLPLSCLNHDPLQFLTCPFHNLHHF